MNEPIKWEILPFAAADGTVVLFLKSSNQCSLTIELERNAAANLAIGLRQKLANGCKDYTGMKPAGRGHVPLFVN